MVVKIVVIVLLLAILATLMTSLVFLVRDPSSRRRTLTGLKIRVALSVSLILFVLLSYQQGWIRPHGVLPTPPPAAAPAAP
ncbi:MAG TPA: DUF2909 domain-containing protein [Solimonas sp.]|nr:DUF2909 domain-containing protein [Solimonas sp.]